MSSLPRTRALFVAYSLTLLFGQVATLTAGPPLVTDDPQTPGRRGWEVNLSHNIESTRDEFLMKAPLIDINYGFLENDQFKVEFAVSSIDPAGQPNHWGVSDLLVGYKYRFLEEEEFGWMVSFYPQVLAPIGNSHLGLGSGSTEVFVPFQFGKNFGNDRLFVYGEIGCNAVLDDSDANGWKYGVAGEWKANEKLTLLGELASFIFPQDIDPDDVFFNAGLKYELTPHASLIGSAGRSFRDRRDGTLDFMSYLGIQFTWGAGDRDE